jgi:hypothetical protein
LINPNVDGENIIASSGKCHELINLQIIIKEFGDFHQERREKNG